MLCRCQSDQEKGTHSFAQQHSSQMSSSPPLPAQLPASRTRPPSQIHAKASSCSSAALHAPAATRKPRRAARTPQSAHAGLGSRSGRCDPWRAAPPRTLGPSFNKVLASFQQRKAISCTDHSSSAKDLSRPALSRLSARLQALQVHAAAAPHVQSSTRRASEEDSIESTAASALGRTCNLQGMPQAWGGHAAETPQIPGTQPGAQAQPRCNSTLTRAPKLSYAAADAPAVRTIPAKVDAAACSRAPADISAEASDQVRRCWDCTQ